EKKLAAFSATASRFLQFPIGDRRCNRTRASVGNAGGNARPSLDKRDSSGVAPASPQVAFTASPRDGVGPPARSVLIDRPSRAKPLTPSSLDVGCWHNALILRCESSDAVGGEANMP